MQAFDRLGGLLVAVLIFQLIPGPGTLTILRASADHGVRAGFAAVAGTLLGGVVCMLAAACGLEAMFRGQPEALHALKGAGAVYLLWMGVRMMRARQAAVTREAPRAPTAGRLLRRSLAVSLTNPKVILFYFALMPLLFRPPMTATTLTAMMICVTGTSLLYQTGLVIVGAAVARRLSSRPSVCAGAQQVAGLLFVAFAVKLFAM